MSQRRDEIIQAARVLIEANPRSSPSVRDLARAVAVSPAALYTHFRDLDDVLVHVRRSVALDMFESSQAAVRLVEHADGAGLAAVANAANVDWILEHPGLCLWMGFTNHLGTGGVEHQLARVLHGSIGLPIEAGTHILEMTFTTLATVPVLAEKPGIDRDALVRYVNEVQQAMSLAILEAARRRDLTASLSENPARM